jgi:hypothetical protein
LQKSRSSALAAVLGITVGITLLAGCTSAPAPVDAAPDTQQSAAPEESAAPAPASDAKTAEWAAPVTIVGDKIASFSAGDITIDVYQVGVTKATKTGNFADPNGKPIISPGDDIVFVNYVVTNNGAPIDLGASLVNVQARYADWPYLQGMDAITDSALYASMGVSSNAMAPNSYRDPGVYTFGTGESYNLAENFRYQKDSPINFTASVTPVDSSASLQHDKRVEAEASGTIK